MPPGHPIILLKSNQFNMAAVSVKRSICVNIEFRLDKNSRESLHTREFRHLMQTKFALCR